MSQNSSRDKDDSVAGSMVGVQQSVRTNKHLTFLFYSHFCAVPSMMEMCTALRRVLGTLVERGPWVMDGQLLLGTMPALNSTHTHAPMSGPFYTLHKDV